MSLANTNLPAEGARSPLQWRQAWLTIDQNPAAQAFASSWIGKICVHVVVVLAFAVSLNFTTASLALITLTLFAVALMPSRRLPIIRQGRGPGTVRAPFA